MPIPLISTNVKLSAQSLLSLSLIFALLGCGTGCSPIEPKKNSSGPKFANSRMTNDAVALEIGLVQLDDSQTESFEQFWRLLDVQKLDIGSRQRLDLNGLRVGLMPSHPPADFLELVKARPTELESLDLVEQKLAERGKLEPKPRMVVHQRITNRRSETCRVETSPIHPSYEWKVRRSDQDAFGSGEWVQGIVEINVSPQSDGTAKIRMTPRINFGPVQTTIGVGEKEFAYDSGRAGQTLSELSFEVVLRPGETIVLAPTSDRADLGRLFFDAITPPDAIHRTPSHLTHRVLLVRLVQTQLDELFGNSYSGEPLSTNFSR